MGENQAITMNDRAMYVLDTEYNPNRRHSAHSDLRLVDMLSRRPFVCRGNAANGGVECGKGCSRGAGWEM